MRKFSAFFLALSVMAAVLPFNAPAGTLAVPEKFQEYDQWCWAGCSQAILSYYGDNYTQTQIAQYGTQGYNTWNWLWGYDNEAPYYRRGIDYILNNFGAISSTARAYALSQGTITSEINAGRPFVIRWGWAPDWTSGHFIVGRGIIGSTVYFMNPWPGEGYGVGTYDWVVYGSDGSGTHKWDYSLQLTTSPASSSTRAPLQLFAGRFGSNQVANIVIFRPSSGLWAIRGGPSYYFGRSGDIPVPSDYTGNGTSNIAVFRPSSGLWAIRGVGNYYFGRSGDIPVPADYNYDGKADIAVFRPSSGLWAIRGVSNYYFGRSGDVPVPGPYVTRSGLKGRANIAIFRPSSGLWAIRGVGNYYFGRSGDVPVPGDYDSSSAVSTRPWRPAIFRPSTGLWSVRNYGHCYFGRSGDTPVPGDYGGDWGDEVGIFRPSSGMWAIEGYQPVYFGRSGDTPATR